MAKLKDEEIYNFILWYVLLHGYAPSFQEIVDGTNIMSKQTVHAAMKRLMAKGLIETDIPDWAHRAYRVKELVVRRRD